MMRLPPADSVRKWKITSWANGSKNTHILLPLPVSILCYYRWNMGSISKASKGLKAVFFDVDGVLIDSVAIKGDCFVLAFSDFPDKGDQIRHWHEMNGGVNREDKIRAIIKEVLGLYEPDRGIAKRVEEYGKLVANRVISAPEIPGARVALTALEGETPLFAASATPCDELNRILTARGDAHFFTEIFGWPVTKKVAITSVLEQYSIDPAKSVLIGDSIQDFEAAKSTGIRFILVSGKNGHSFCDADAVIEDLTTLLPALAQVAGTE
jgi:phosphoglycolate phosphatase